MTIESDTTEEFETRAFHTNSYSSHDSYCKFQGICEYYSYSCRLGEITPSDCGYAKKLFRAERRIQKARRLG